jgi:hypothetical protein
MSAADLARLELAKRAYRSTEPSATEVQRGVRKARLGLRRPRARTTWLTKTVVGVVLAMGGLAFAKPQALGELVQTALQSVSNAPNRASGSGGAPAAPVAQRPAADAVPHAKVAVAPAPAASASSQADSATAGTSLLAGRRESAKPPGVRKPAVAASDSAVPEEALTGSEARSPIEPKALPDSFPDAATDQATTSQVSDWGRVGSALARGDESRALAVLNELSESEDRRTRDKADLGRAQLMMSNGNREQACATARSLTNRGAGSLIERQALLLLKGCQR